MRNDTPINSDVIRLLASELWYQKSLLPSFIKTKNININDLTPLKLLEIFGVIAYLIKIINNFKLLHQYLIKNEDKSRRYDKAFFVTVDTCLTITAGIGIFILHALWSTPCIISISSVSLVKSTYSVVKNVKQFDKMATIINNQSVKMNKLSKSQMFFKPSTFGDQKPIEKQVNKIKLKRHQLKVQRSTFDLTCSIFALGLSILSLYASIPACFGFAVLTIVWYYGRNHLTKQTSHLSKLTKDIDLERDVELSEDINTCNLAYR